MTLETRLIGEVTALAGVAEVYPAKNSWPGARQSVVIIDASDQVSVVMRIGVATGHKAPEVLATVAATIRHILDGEVTGSSYQIDVQAVRIL